MRFMIKINCIYCLTRILLFLLYQLYYYESKSQYYEIQFCLVIIYVIDYAMYHHFNCSDFVRLLFVHIYINIDILYTLRHKR